MGHKLVYGCWEEHGNEMLLLPLAGEEGWVVTTRRDMQYLTACQAFAYYAQPYTWYNPIGFPPFMSFHARHLSDKEVTGQKTGRAHPIWSKYTPFF